MSVGDPPSRDAGSDREAVAAAVRDVLLEKGYKGLTVAEVAGRVGADESAIYQEWPSKVDLVTWVLVRNYRRQVGGIDTGGLRDDLLTFLSRFMATLRGTYGSVAAAVLAQVPGARERELAQVTDEVRSFLQGEMTRMLDRAARRGEIGPGGPFDLVGEIVRAVALYRLNVSLEPLNEEFSHELVDRILLPALRRGSTPRAGPVPRTPTGPAPRAGPGSPTRRAAPRASPPERPDGPELDLEAVAAAVMDVLLEKGYDGLTVAEVARRSIVEVPAIRQRWPSKVELVRSILVRNYRRQVGGIDTGGLRDDLLTFLSRFTATLSGPYGSVVVVVLARSRDTRKGEMAEEIGKISDLLQGEVNGILDRAVRRGEIDAGGPFDLVGEIVRAVVLYRLHVSMDPLDEEFCGDLVDRILLPALGWRCPSG